MFIVPLLLAVTTLAQDTAAPAPRARAARLAPLAAATASLQASAAALAAQAPVLAAEAQALVAQAAVLAPSAVEVLETVPPEAWAQDDPADSLYRAGRRALNRGRYQDAVAAFSEIINKYPRSTYAGDALYWVSFALYRTGDTKNLQRAVEFLTRLRDTYPDADMRGDAETLAARVDGVLAQRGDAAAAERNQARADSARGPEARASARAARPPREPREPRPVRPPRETRSSGCDDEDDIRIAALNAVLQMDAERAVPLLKTVLARRDEGSVCLRRKAMFLVSQKRTPETARILLDAVRSDPDQEVREQGVFWLSQVPGDEAVTALDSILRASDDANVQDKAIFALSQHRSERAAGILRAYAERRDAPGELREKAIFWLGQRKSPENATFLRALYGRLENDDLKEKVIFSLSQMGGEDNYRWLMDIALNEREDIEIRKKALFWAGQGRTVDIADLVQLYDRTQNREMKDQLIFVYSQRREAAAMDKLFDIGKNEPDRELRKKAIFWIGQSRDPRAARFLQDLINQ